MAYKNIKIPSVGEKISFDKSGKLAVPDNPIIPYIEGDGIGIDISPAMIAVVDKAVEVAYEGKKKSDFGFFEKPVELLLFAEEKSVENTFLAIVANIKREAPFYQKSPGNVIP